MKGEKVRGCTSCEPSSLIGILPDGWRRLPDGTHGQDGAFDRDLIRGGHYGQRSCEPHLKAKHMALFDVPKVRLEIRNAHAPRFRLRCARWM